MSRKKLTAPIIIRFCIILLPFGEMVHSQKLPQLLIKFKNQQTCQKSIEVLKKFPNIVVSCDVFAKTKMRYYKALYAGNKSLVSVATDLGKSSFVDSAEPL